VTADAPTGLTATEQRLLEVLLDRAGRPVSREELLRQVWGRPAGPTRVVDVTVSRLRRRLADQPSLRLSTVRGAGYCLETTASSEDTSGGLRVGVPRFLDLPTARVDLLLRLVRGPAGDQPLSGAEADLLVLLVRADGRPQPARALAGALWGAPGAARRLTAAVARLRAKLEPTPRDPVCLVTIPGEGYVLRLRPPASPALDQLTSGVITRPIGRESDLASLRAALTEARLVTLHGPGGVGKTALALHAARLETRPDGGWPGAVVAVDLQDAGDGDDVSTAVAAELGLEVDPRDGARLAQAIAAGGRRLLVLDNLERVAPQAAARVATWLGACPELSVLTTSRVLLGLAGERTVELGPLAGADAEELFLRHLHADGETWPEDLARSAAAEVTRRFGGLPLALVLAAAWARRIGPDALTRRLRTGVQLTTSPDDAHRFGSLRGAIDHSWELLAPADRDAFARLAVFSGSFGEETAGAVLDPDSAADLLHRLSARALLARGAQEDDPSRRRLAPSLRDYARRHLAADELQATERLHAGFFAGRARDWRALLEGPRAGAALDAMERARPDLKAIVRRCRRSDPLTACRAASALAALACWREVGSPTAAASRAVGLARRAGPANVGRLARATLDQAHAELLDGTAEAALSCLDRAAGIAPADDLSLCVRLAATRMRCLSALGRDPADLSRLAADALEQAVECGDRLGEAEVLVELAGAQLRAGNRPAAVRQRRRALRLVLDAGAALLEPACRLALAEALERPGRTDEARDHREQALARARRLRLPRIEAACLAALG